jgi:hypothetical protein
MFQARKNQIQPVETKNVFSKQNEVHNKPTEKK